MKYHKKIVLPAIFALILLFGLSGNVHAVPAAPRIHTLEQADGSQFKAILWGDEWYHGWETLNGYTILFDEETKNWVYADVSGGHLVKTKLIVTKHSPVGITKHLRDPERVAKAKEMREKSISKSAPTSGDVKFPVFLINFTDTSISYAPSDFDDLLFGNHFGTMKDYYNEVSYGHLNITGVVSGWYTAEKGHDYYGKVVLFWDDFWAPKLVREAVEKADEAGFDFSQYDNDGDGYVDCVIVIHQGTGQEASGNSSDIWSHRWKLSAAPWSWLWGGAYHTDDGVIVDDYTIQPEILAFDGNITTVGVFCHEIGHIFGLPDLYDTDYSSEGIGDWGLMGGGSWNFISRPGDTPAHLIAWSKWVLGWVHPKRVIGILSNESIEQVEYNDDVYQLLDNPNGPSDWGGGEGEYFLIENRQRVGYDAGLDGDGLLIWHIDESRKNNDNEDHKLVDLEAADGRTDLDEGINDGDAGDPFPGTANNRKFGKNTNPNSNLYLGVPSGAEVVNISDSGATMTATLKVSPVVTAKADQTTIEAGNKLWGNRIIVNPTNLTLHYKCVNEIRNSTGDLQKSWEISGYLDAQNIWNKRGYIYIPAWAPGDTYTYIAILYDADTGEELDRTSVDFTVIKATGAKSKNENEEWIIRF